METDFEAIPTEPLPPENPQTAHSPSSRVPTPNPQTPDRTSTHLEVSSHTPTTRPTIPNPHPPNPVPIPTPHPNPPTHPSVPPHTAALEIVLRDAEAAPGTLRLRQRHGKEQREKQKPGGRGDAPCPTSHRSRSCTRRRAVWLGALGLRPGGCRGGQRGEVGGGRSARERERERERVVRGRTFMQWENSALHLGLHSSWERASGGM
ncbi:hypothetical protein K505DRAFT_70056 [Melanomma pulvis-pyrius CBS 109.77]|uniref:Uncharacterized protein n=1 Tax=Melanomma pulvis-pyrius CBS 109.77 TaxID=1314802 RepID=A0A6A6XWQ0_9PLEO|nr:hypothetical protein K505DRAFT_70056 [Melanomma pulvis-pyrius CBS 109.77]